MPSRGTADKPRGKPPQRQPNPARDEEDKKKKSNKRGYRSAEAVNRRKTQKDNNKQKRALARLIKRCLPKEERERRPDSPSKQGLENRAIGGDKYEVGEYQTE